MGTPTVLENRTFENGSRVILGFESRSLVSLLQTGEMGTPTVLENRTFENGSRAILGSESRPLVSLAVPLIMFVAGVFGNVVALLFLWQARRDNTHSVFYRLVAGLAVTDLVGILATTPVTIVVYNNNRQWVGGQPLCTYFSFMMIFAGLATVFIVGAMAVERYLAILHPYAYESHVRPARVKYVMGLILLVAVLISCLPLIGLGRNVRYFPGTWCFFDFYSDRTADKIFSFFYASLGLLVIAATAVCNIAVMCTLLRMRRISTTLGKSNEGRTLNMTSEMQMIFFLAGIVVVFATCYVPLMVRVIINQSKLYPRAQEKDLLVIRLASVNQILDPWVYILFRRRLAALLYTACKSASPIQSVRLSWKLRSQQHHETTPRCPKVAPDGGCENGGPPKQKLEKIIERECVLSSSWPMLPRLLDNGQFEESTAAETWPVEPENRMLLSFSKRSRSQIIGQRGTPSNMQEFSFPNHRTKGNSK